MVEMGAGFHNQDAECLLTVKALPGLVPGDLTSFPPFTLWALVRQPHLTLRVLFPVGSYTSPAHCLQHPPLRSPFGSYSASDPSLISLPHRTTPRTQLTPPGSGRGPSQKCWSDTCPGQVGWWVRSQNLNRPYTVVRFHE